MYEDFEDRMAAEHQNRRRQAADLDHIRRYYALESRHSIRVAIGGRVRHNGREGEIVDTAGPYLVVLRDGDEQPVRCHATSNMEYATAAVWVAVTPISDPYTAVPAGAAQ
ncbi:hypothetical protein ACFWOJ_31700 [Streptomyces sp. NPDC058439]|uniref:hypothetical protein n=1 Tax=Streptomyces sp. NPDC058439 TaxID=3346500 RepID=UPI00365CD38B